MVALCLVASASAANAKWPTDAASVATTVKCTYDGAWGDTCKYDNLCFRGGPNSLTFITDDPQLRTTVMKKRGSTPIQASTKLFRVMGNLPDPSRFSPMHFKVAKAEVMSTSDALRGRRNIRWMDQALWVPSYFEKLGNIWFYSSRILPLFSASLQAEMLGLPPMDEVMIGGPEEKIRSDW